MRFRSFGRRFYLFSQTTLFIINVIIGARRGDKRQKELVEKYNRLADCRMIHNDGNFQVDKKCTGWHLKFYGQVGWTILDHSYFLNFFVGPLFLDLIMFLLKMVDYSMSFLSLCTSNFTDK